MATNNMRARVGGDAPDAADVHDAVDAPDARAAVDGTVPVNDDHDHISDDVGNDGDHDRVDARATGPEPPPVSADQSAFLAWVGGLVHAHRAQLARVARREGLGPEDAFDAVQEAFRTFITLPRARALVDEADPSRQLLVALTRNIARNRRRLHALARPHQRDADTLDGLASETSTVEDLIVAAEEHVRLAACMATLAELPKTVVTLRMLDEVPGEDAARILGITPGHIAVLLHRAKASLLACMTSCHGDAPAGD